MSLFAKIMVVVNLIFAVMFLAAAGTFLGAADNWKQKHSTDTADLQSQVDDLKGQVKTADDNITQLKSQNASMGEAKADAESKLTVLQASNQTLKANADNVQASLDTLTAAQTDLQNKLSEQQTEIGRLNDSLSNETARRRDGESKIATLQENLEREDQARKDAVAAMEAAEGANNELNKVNEGLNTVIGLYEKTYGALSVKAQKPLDGVIQSVSNADDIYVISLGEKDGVEVGYQFTVSRGSQYVNVIVVDKVFPNYASARSKKGLKKMDVKAGDSVSNKL